MRVLSIILGLTLLLHSCNLKKTEAKHNNYHIKSISVSATTCYGKCPEMDISFDRSGKVNFFGGNYSSPTGYNTAKLSKDQWEFLEKRASKLLEKYSKDTILPEFVRDAIRYDILVTTDKKSVRILGYDLHYPKEGLVLVGAVQKIQKELTFKASKDTLIFSTKREGM